MIWWHCYSTFIDTHLWVRLRFGYVAQNTNCHTFCNAQSVIIYQFSWELFLELSLYFNNNLYKVACQTNQCASINITINTAITTWPVWNVKNPFILVSWPLNMVIWSYRSHANIVTWLYQPTLIVEINLCLNFGKLSKINLSWLHHQLHAVINIKWVFAEMGQKYKVVRFWFLTMESFLCICVKRSFFDFHGKSKDPFDKSQRWKRSL